MPKMQYSSTGNLETNFPPLKSMQSKLKSNHLHQHMQRTTDFNTPTEAVELTITNSVLRQFFKSLKDINAMDAVDVEEY